MHALDRHHDPAARQLDLEGVAELFNLGRDERERVVVEQRGDLAGETLARQHVPRERDQHAQQKERAIERQEERDVAADDVLDRGHE